MNRFASFTALALLSVGSLACDEDPTDTPGQTDPLTEACEHFELGPFEQVVATADPAQAPDGTFAHTHVTVTLADLGGDNGGSVSWIADEDTEVSFFVGAAVPLILTDAQGTDIPAEGVEAVDPAACALVATVHTFDVEVGSYTLTFGPTTEATVSFAFEEGGEHAHED